MWNRDFADLESGVSILIINNDGQKKRVPRLANGSAFLVLDINNNQRIDDGSDGKLLGIAQRMGNLRVTMGKTAQCNISIWLFEIVYTASLKIY